ncbi:hypothetical protein F5Y04DRAFT_221738 [Hypomontagnella monticulosa]|nr:hypothetical protein F5Y04DRAFT_221738 [Hypomontagnella monticulosa]
MSSAAEAQSCDIIQGNPDFYGLGIRVGVYLQWISSWISLRVDPLSAQTVYDVNSVFVFAILVATMIASLDENPTIQPIETHIMLQFALGFFATTLSTFGIRLYFLRPNSTAALREQLKESIVVFREIRASLPKPTSFKDHFKLASGRLSSPLKIPMRAFSPIKPYHLSWSGVMWRTTTLTMIAVMNVWLWFGPHQNYRLPGQDCDPPFVFMFSKQQLSGSIVGFFKAVSILIAIIVFPPFTLLFQLTALLLQRMLMALYRDMLHYVLPEAPERLRQSLDRVNSILNKNQIRFPMFDSFSTSVKPAIMPQFRGIFDFVEFISKPGEETFRFSDMLKLMVSLGSGKVDHQYAMMQAEKRETPHMKEANYLERQFSFLWNNLIFLSITWFILSIEFTLAWNNIQGINGIDSTGQLVPFVIGCVSAAQVLKKVVLLGLAKKYEDWADTTLEVSMDLSSKQEIFRIHLEEKDRQPQEEGLTSRKTTMRGDQEAGKDRDRT